MSGSAIVGANFEDDIDAMMASEIGAALGQSVDHHGPNPNTQNNDVTNSKNEESDEKYDLSKDAYVLVLRNYEHSDSDSGRAGSQIDMRKIEGFFRSYRTEPVQLEVHDNLTKLQIQELMEEVRERDFSSNSCLIVIILGQVRRENFIATQTGEYSIRYDIIEHVTANKKLADKPKIFIVSATYNKDAVDTDSMPVKESNKVDTILFQSANEEPSPTGSFFLSTFFEVLRENDGRNVDEISMLLIKHAKDQGQPQAPLMQSTLRKRLIFSDLRK